VESKAIFRFFVVTTKLTSDRSSTAIVLPSLPIGRCSDNWSDRIVTNKKTAAFYKPSRLG